MNRVLFLLTLLVFLVKTADASVIFSTVADAEMAGVPVSGRAKFTIDSSNHILTIELTNTSHVPTPNNTQILTGVTWQIQPENIISSLTLTPDFSSNPTLTAGSDIWKRSGNPSHGTWSINNSVPIGGSWTNSLSGNPPGDDNYGYSTSGQRGLFQAGTLLLGNGGGDFGIVSSSTFGGTNIDFPSDKPLVQNSVTIRFAYTGTLTDSNIVAAHIFFNTDGTNFGTDRSQDIPPPEITEPVPEPISLAIWSLGALGCAARAYRRRRAA